MAILLAFLVGAVQLLITLLRLGDLNRYISHAVIVGFTLGAAVLIVLDQIKNLLGLPRGSSGDEHFIIRFWHTISHIDQTHLADISGWPGNGRDRADPGLCQSAVAISDTRFAHRRRVHGRGRVGCGT